MERIEVIVDGGAIDENAKKKYEAYIDEIGLEDCKDKKGLLFDDLILDDAYVDEKENTVCFYFRRWNAKVCEDVEVSIQLSIDEFAEFLAKNREKLLNALKKLENSSNDAKNVIS